ncbi:MAG TPA: DUF4157 domain-containing protein [Pyrinomonadaceae bacterium]|nr:DUF4157 domain-containing protein [Pyrinomonadaceae bacterium]
MQQTTGNMPLITGTLQRKSAWPHRSLLPQEDSSKAPSLVNDVLRSPGESLDSTTRESMEPRFGYDFSHVRVHTDPRAAASARAVGALAYTVGSHLVFDHGEYAPQTVAGRQLLAHELTHSVQQSTVSQAEAPTPYLRLLPSVSSESVASSVQIGRPVSQAETEADHVSHNFDSGFSVTSSIGPGHVLQRQAATRPAQTSRPEDFGITLAVVDHGATGVRAAARERLDEIYRTLSPANLGVLQSSGVTRIEMHIIPYDKKIIDLPEFARLRGTPTPDGRLWDNVRGEGGIRDGSIIRYSVGEENLSGGRHGHGAAIGLGILGGVGIGAAGAVLGQSIGSQSGQGLLGGILGGVVGAAVGAVGLGLLGNLIDEDSGYATNFTASHEGAHTIELFALTSAQQTRVQTLFNQRTAAHGPWLEPTDYTSSNQHEYWAQCSAAFFSRPYEDRYASSYNPEWLRRNDPGMYTLLSEVYGGTPSARRADMPDMQDRERAAA